MQGVPLNPPRISMSCLERIIRFVLLDMTPDEAMTFVAHVQDCFDCRDYIKTLSSVLDCRERILDRLEYRLEGRGANDR